MKSRKEAGQLRQQLEKIKALQEIKRQKNEMARKIREGIPITPNDHVSIDNYRFFVFLHNVM